MDQIRRLVRRMLHSPMFTAIAVATLAIGIGANTAIFSVIDSVLLRPLPYPDSERLVTVRHTAPGLNIKELPASPSSYFTYREEGRMFQDIGLWSSGSVSVTGLAEPEQVASLNVTDCVLPILGVQPMLGRWFTRKDDTPGSPETVMLTYGYWQRKFGGQPSAIGQRIVVDGRAREVIGVMPRSFLFLNARPLLILPLQFNRTKLFVGNFSYQGVARLKGSATVAEASSDVARMLPIVAQKFPPPPGLNLKMFEEARIGPNVRPLKQDVIGDVGNVLWVLMGTLGIVLLIACANVANLLLVRADGRQQELAIRAALGAGWGRIARELLLESFALAMTGGAVGLGLAYVAVRSLVAMGPANLPRLDEISIDPRVLLFTLGISLLSGLLFGLIPVFKYAGPNLETALRGGGRTVSQGRERHRARSVLVIVQVALALVLLISSGLMIRTFRALKQVHPGFTRPGEVLTLRLSIPYAQVNEPERVVRMQNDIINKIVEIPGVSSVGLSTSITMDGNTSFDPIFAEDRTYSESQIPPIRRFKWISPGYFRTMGNPLRAGRDVTWTDIYNKTPVALISESLARDYWRDPTSAIGRRIRESVKGQWREIIGVVGNERDEGVDKKPPTTVYWPVLMKGFWSEDTTIRRSVGVAIRSNRTGSESFFKEVRQAVWSVNSNLPIANVRTLQEIYDRSMARTSFTLVMLGLAGGMALLLGVVGLYGVISYSVSQRTREIGIRMALGASQQEVRRMFVGHGLLLTGIGVVCGLGAAVAMTRMMSSLLFEVSPLDPITYCVIPLSLVIAAMLASYVPARRATRVQPIDALRAE